MVWSLLELLHVQHTMLYPDYDIGVLSETSKTKLSLSLLLESFQSELTVSMFLSQNFDYSIWPLFFFNYC